MLLQKHSPSHIHTICKKNVNKLSLKWQYSGIAYQLYSLLSTLLHVQCFFNCFTPFYNTDWWKSLLQWITVHFFYSISTYFLGSGSVDVVSTDFVLKKHLWSLKTKIVIVDFMKHIPTMEFKPSVVLPWYAILQILGGKSPTLTGIVAKYL